MHGYTSFVVLQNPDHHTLQQCQIPCCQWFYNCLGDCCIKAKQRYVICVLTALGLTIAYMQRMCLSIMMTEMVHVQKVHKGGDYCPATANHSGSQDGQVVRFDWDIPLQGNILASFFYGYFVTHIPGGIVADLCGGKHIFGAVILGSSVCTALSPMAANAGPYFLLALRLIMGLIQGPIFPVITSLVAHWSPPEERGLMNTICNTGVPLGLVLGNLGTGQVLGLLEDWVYPFYIYGAMGCVWTVFWLVVAAPSPLSHPYISNQEAGYIVSSLHGEAAGATGRIPWKEIIVDKRFLVATLANLGHETGLFFIATELPIYMFNVMQLGISMNGIISAVPWMTMWLGNVIFGELSIILVKKEILSRISSRRIFGAMCNIVPACCWVFVVFLGCDYIMVAALIGAGSFFVGGVFSSIRASFLDIGPNFAGFSMAVAAGVAGISGFVVPLFVHWLIGEGTKVEDWRLSFFIICGFLACSTIPYLLMISADVQPWNEGHMAS